MIVGGGSPQSLGTGDSPSFVDVTVSNSFKVGSATGVNATVVIPAVATLTFTKGILTTVVLP